MKQIGILLLTLLTMTIVACTPAEGSNPSNEFGGQDENEVVIDWPWQN